MELMTYSAKAVREAMDEVKGLALTVSKRNDHINAASNTKEVMNKCYDLTKDFNFFDTPAVTKYYKTVNDVFFDKTYKTNKKELDEMLRLAVRSLQYEISALAAMLNSGEVNVIA